MTNLKDLNGMMSEAIACNYCFMNDRKHEWNNVPKRPESRLDDLPVLPWVGDSYFRVRPRIIVMMLNPGHAAATHKLDRRDLGKQFKCGHIDYEEYNKRLISLVPQWGFGKISKWLTAVGLDPGRIAFLNMALCAVANDKYNDIPLFTTCFQRHTCNIVKGLEPDIVVLCGKKQLKAFESSIESLGPKVILTWHYRPMNTKRGKAELQRVSDELVKLLV